MLFSGIVIARRPFGYSLLAERVTGREIHLIAPDRLSTDRPSISGEDVQFEWIYKWSGKLRRLSSLRFRPAFLPKPVAACYFEVAAFFRMAHGQRNRYKANSGPDGKEAPAPQSA